VEVRYDKIKEVKRANDRKSGVTDGEVTREDNKMFKLRNDFNFDTSKSEKMIKLFRKGSILMREKFFNLSINLK
jgi:hypothetical protein